MHHTFHARYAITYYLNLIIKIYEMCVKKQYVGKK